MRQFSRFLRVAVPAVAVAASSSMASGAVIYVDFAAVSGAPEENFNTIAVSNSGSTSLDNLIDFETGLATAVDLSLSQTSGGTGTGPGATPDTGTLEGDAAQFGLAAADGLFGRNSGGVTVPTITVVLSELDPNLLYHFVGFAARNNVSGWGDGVRESDARVGLYTFTGTNSGSDTLNATNNVADVFTVDGILPDANGQIVLTVTADESNNNGDNLFYFNALRVESAPVPEPASVALLAAGGVALLGRRRR